MSQKQAEKQVPISHSGESSFVPGHSRQVLTQTFGKAKTGQQVQKNQDLSDPNIQNVSQLLQKPQSNQGKNQGGRISQNFDDSSRVNISSVRGPEDTMEPDTYFDEKLKRNNREAQLQTQDLRIVESAKPGVQDNNNLDFNLIERSRMSQGQKTMADPSRGEADSRLLYPMHHGSPRMRNVDFLTNDQMAKTAQKDEGQMQLHQMMTASLGTTAVHDVLLQTPNSNSIQQSLNAAPGFKRRGNQGSLPPTSTGKSKGKKKKQQQALQDAIQNTSGYTQIMNQAQSPNKKRNYIVKGGSVAQNAQHYSQQVAAVNNQGPAYQSGANTAQTQNQPMTAQTQGSGQNPQGNHGRRRVYDLNKEVANQNKVSQQRLNPAAGLQSMTAIHSKRASQSNQPYNTQGHQKKNQSMSNNSQTYVYFNQIREAAERGINVSGQQQNMNKQTKHRRQPMPIDTFNLVGNRRDSFFNKVAEEQTKEDEHVVQEYTVSAPVGSTTTAQMINVQPTAASASAGGGLILPDIGSNRKTGMSHGQQATSSGIKSTNAHRASNSFSGKTGDGREAVAINTNGSIAEVVNSGLNNKVFSDSGLSPGESQQRSQLHQRAQASADLANTGNLQQPPVLRGGNQQAYLLNANITQASQSNQILNKQQTAVSEDLKRRTTGSLFTSPQGHQPNVSRRTKDEPSDVLSLSTNQAQMKHVQNIVSPIQHEEYLDNNNSIQGTDKNIMIENHKDNSTMQQRTLQGSIPGLPDSGTISRDNSVFFDSVMNKMNPRQGQKKQEILATSKSQRKAKQQRKLETNLSRRGPQEQRGKQYQLDNMKTPKPAYNNDEFASTHQQAPGDLLSGLNSLLSSQPRPFDQMNEEEMDNINVKISEKESISKQDNPDLSIDQDEEEGEDEEDENEEMIDQSLAENYGTIQEMTENQHSQPSFGIHPEMNQNRYKKHPDGGFSGQTGQDYYTHVSSQLQQQAAGKKKKGKRHRRLNTHHHYHIDLNFEQVNNILVSYGGVAHQQLFKNQKKESSKNAANNVSVSLSGVPNNQQRGQSTQNQQRQFNTNATSPVKRVHPNPLQLPELIINKNKINFNQKTINQQEAVQAAAMRTSSRKVENNGFITYGTNARPSKSQKRQGGSLKPKKKDSSYQNASTIIDDSMNRDVYPQRKSKDSRSKQQLIDRMNLHAQQISQQQMMAGQMTGGSHEKSEQDAPSIIMGPEAVLGQDSRNSHNKVSEKNFQTNQKELHKQGSKLSTQWRTADRQNESKDMIQDETQQTNMRQTTGPTGHFKQQSAATPHTKAMLQQKSVGGNSGAGKFRQKQHLQVQTFKQSSATNHAHGHSLNSAMETPKRYFNVKNQSQKKVVKMAVMEHHSAGLRPSRSGVKEKEEEPKPTLSQISSVVSNNESETKKPQPQVANKKPSIKYGRGESMRSKQNRLEQQFEKTHKILEQFNQNLNEQSGMRHKEPDSPDPTSPNKLKEKKKVYKPKINDFEIECTVGVGNFGKVHKAFNKDQQRECALKVLLKESVAEMKHVDHVINEREVLQYLSDLNTPVVKPFVIKQEKQIGSMSRVREDSDSDDFVPCNECPFLMNIYSSFQDLDNLYFELEYIEGCTLLSQIRSYNQSVMQNMPYYTAEVLMTLEFLHNNNVIYRDLKPENIVISMNERGHLKLVDFGFAKRLKNIQDRTHTNCGTPAYISPEVLLGPASAGHGYQADIWSLGVLMCEIVSGQTPFQGESTQEVYENVTKCVPVYNKQISATLRDLLDKIFVGDPDTRISLQQIKKHPVFKDYDFSVTMPDRFRSYGPYIPDEPMFNERADRDSEQMQEAAPKPKNILAALMGNPMNDPSADKAPRQQNLDFNEAHYDKFEREAKKNMEGEEQKEQPRRKRNNPLGDFKFKRINELF